VILLLVAMLVVAACIIAAAVVSHQRAMRSETRELPPLIYPGMRSWQTEPVRQTEPLRHAEPVRDAEPVLPVQTTRSPVVAELANEEPSSSETVHFRRPSDQALQLLPGHLEVLSGLAVPREIRFVRIPGERPQLILGREPGSSPPHVALPSSTVSRKHARLDFSGGRWGLTNLSRTNPVVVNDETLSSADGERPLTDGDRIELGDVVLRFSVH
jgi:hypothetical protein